jgi:hypothetical protein
MSEPKIDKVACSSFFGGYFWIRNTYFILLLFLSFTHKNMILRNTKLGLDLRRFRIFKRNHWMGLLMDMCAYFGRVGDNK